MLDLTKKDTLHPRAKEKPNKMVGGAKSHLEANLIPSRDTWRAQTERAQRNTVTPQRLSQTCL